MTNRFSRGLGVVLLAGASALALQPASADAIKYRQAVMKAVGGHMGSMGQIIKGQVDHKSHLAPHAKAMAATLALTLEAFEEKTMGGETRALDKIWADWSGFEAKANDAVKAAQALVTAAESGGDVGAAMKGLGKTCGGCHKPYRKKKQ